MNNKIEFKTGDFVKCKTWGGLDILAVYEYPHPNNSHCVVDARTNIHYNIRKNDIHHASEDELDIIRFLVQINDIKVREQPTSITLGASKPKKQESEFDLILKPITEIS